MCPLLADTDTKRRAGAYACSEVFPETVDHGSVSSTESRAELSLEPGVFKEKGTGAGCARQIRRIGKDGDEREQHHDLSEERHHDHGGNREAAKEGVQAALRS